MEILHKDSTLCTDSRLHCFNDPPTESSIESEFYETFYPTVPSTGPQTPVEFQVSNLSPATVLSFEGAHLEIKCKITKSDGTDAATAAVADNVRVNNMAGPCIFKSLEVHCNNVMVSGFEHYPLRTYFELITKTTKNFRDSIGSLYGYTDQSTATWDSVGSKFLFKLGEGSKEMNFILPLSTDIAQIQNFLMYGCELRIVCHQNEDSYRLVHKDAAALSHTLKIISCKLKVKKVKLCDNVSVALERKLSTSPCNYVLPGFDTRFRTLSADAFDYIIDDFFVVTPSYLLIGFQDNNVYNGDHKSDSLTFKHASVAEIILQIGSQQIRRSYDFTNKTSLAGEYLELMNNLGKTECPFSFESFSDGTKFMCLFDLSPNSDTCLPRIKRESCRLQIVFKNKLEAPLTMVVISETPRIMSVDSSRSVQLV